MFVLGDSNLNVPSCSSLFNSEAMSHQEKLLPLIRNRREKKIVSESFCKIISRISETDGLEIMEKHMPHQGFSFDPVLDSELIKSISWL